MALWSPKDPPQQLPPPKEELVRRLLNKTQHPHLMACLQPT
jgi:hypothetical protein